MANASNETLGRVTFRQFATKNFLREVLSDGDSEYIRHREYLPSSPMDRTAWVERYGWFRLGAAIGYFKPSFSELGAIRVETREIFLPDKIYAPGRLVELISSFLADDTSEFLNPNLPVDDAALQGKFQAALLAAEAFDDPLLIALVAEIRNPEDSPLDKMIVEFNPKEMYGALNENYPNLWASDRGSVLLAAMCRLICVFQAFADLFPDSTDEPEEHALPTLKQIVGTLLCWRIDLEDERTSRRLINLNTGFLRLVNAARLSNREQFDWPIESTNVAAVELIVHWERLTKDQSDRFHNAGFGIG